MEPLGIYVHIPFCVRKCLYCDFASFGTASGLHGLIGDYVSALGVEIRREAAAVGQRNVKSIFFGGGTPSLLSPKLIGRVMEELTKSFAIRDDAEITLEANPGTMTKAVLKELCQLGINRLSLGVQSFSDPLLRRLGRIHTATEAIRTYQAAREAGFGNINLDLMYGIPGQTLGDWVDTLEQVVRLQPEHVAAYSLIVEAGTPFGEWYERGILDIPNEDDTADMMVITQVFLEKAGWHRYEISNYAKVGFQSVHNRIYWKNQEYLGFGAAAYSYLDGVRRANTSSVQKYVDNVLAGISPVVNKEHLDLSGQMSETIMLGLRLREGVDLESFRQRFGVELLNEYRPQVQKLQALRLIEIVDTEGGSRRWMRLTPRGFEVANSVIVEFFR